ncbi:MAG: Asp-tRNA(Asn)/Glu-tRNA(Gln) amidotransferase subunit GatC [Clostridia bacterium]|nr:Asp-tRNA(Asn)/Glu-tRNA(Gln) amidotransferase subunit GatC [Clostridia bacterium]
MVSHEDVIQIARLAKLSVSDEELDGLTKEMQSIIDFADAINNAPVDGEEFDNINNLSNAFREDIVVPSYPTEKILENANDSAEDCFLVKKRSL